MKEQKPKSKEQLAAEEREENLRETAERGAVVALMIRNFSHGVGRHASATRRRSR